MSRPYDIERSFLDAGTTSAEARARRGLSSVCLGLPGPLRDLTDELLAPDCLAVEGPPAPLPPPRFLSAYLRVRPPLPGDDTSQESPVEVASATHVLMRAPKSSVAYKNCAPGTEKLVHRFGFSGIFDAGVEQRQVFASVMVHHISQLLSGHSCLLFTYGASNSGKTYTIYGPPRNPASDPGLLPRTMDTLFNSIGSRLYRRLDVQPTGFNSACLADIQREQLALANKFSVLRAARQAASGDTTTTSTATDCSAGDTTGSDTGGKSLCGGGGGLRLGDLQDRVREPTTVSVDSQPHTRYSVWISFVEIYNEYIFDLLAPVSGLHGHKRKPLGLGIDKKASPYIKGVREVEVRSADEACMVLHVGQSNLHFATTQLNHNSSRSHCIVTVKVLRVLDAGSSAEADPAASTRCSLLTICDLAGSERVEKSHVRGSRLKEAGNINTSLMVLGRCLKALRQLQQQVRDGGGDIVRGPSSLPVMGHHHQQQQSAAGGGGGAAAVKSAAAGVSLVPYRDSKLTRLFQAFFSGQAGHVTLLVNIGPDARVFDETLQVLKFSAMAKQVSVQAAPKPRQRSRISMMARASLHAGRGGGTSGGGMLPQPLLESTTLEQAAEQQQQQQQLNMLKEAAVETYQSGQQEPPEQDCQYLLDLLDKINNELIETKREKDALDSRIRNELTDKFQLCVEDLQVFYKDKIAETELRSMEIFNKRLATIAEEKTMSQEEANERVQAAEERCSCLQQQLDALQLQHVHNSQQLTKLRAKNAELRATNAKISADILQTREQLEEFEEKNTDLLLATRDETIEQLNKELIELRKTLKQQTVELTEAQELIGEGGAECVRLEDENETLTARVRQMTATIDQLTDELSNKQGQIADLELLCQSHSERVAQLESELAEQAETEELEQTMHETATTPIAIPSSASKRRSAAAAAVASPMAKGAGGATAAADKLVALSLPCDLNSTALFELTERQVIQDETMSSLVQSLKEKLQSERTRCEQLQTALSGQQLQQLETANELVLLQQELKRSVKSQSQTEQLVGQLQQQLEDSRRGEERLQASCQVLEARLAASAREQQAFDVITAELDCKKADCRTLETQLAAAREQMERATAAEQSAVACRESISDQMCKLQLQNTELTRKLSEKDADLAELRDRHSQQMLLSEQHVRRLADELQRERQERCKIQETMGRLTAWPSPAPNSELERLRGQSQQKDGVIDQLRRQLHSLTPAATDATRSAASTKFSTSAAVHFASEEQSDKENTPMRTRRTTRNTPASRSRSARAKCQPTSSSSNRALTGSKRKPRPRRNVVKSSDDGEYHDESSTEPTSPDCQSATAASAGGDTSPGSSNRSTSAAAAAAAASKRRLFQRLSQEVLRFSPHESAGCNRKNSPRRIVTRQLRSRTCRR